MKIAVSAYTNKEDSLLDLRFGRCEYFQVFDSESLKSTAIKNKGADCSGGAGIVASQQLVDEKVDVVITGNIGPNAFEIMEKAEIKTYKCDSLEMLKVVEKYNKKELEEITFSAPAHNGMKQ